MTIATAFGRELYVTDAAKRCSVLFVNPGAPPTPYRSELEALGFLVLESDGWPDDDRTALDHQVIVLRLRHIRGADMLAARLRAKPRFGHRVLIALVAGPTTTQERAAACVSGFDDVLMDSCSGRQLAASVLKRLRLRPEYECFLPPDSRSSAA